MIKNVYRSSCEIPFILIGFEWKFNFLDIFAKNTQISNFMKIRPVGSQMFRADTQTAMTKLIVAFRNFVNAPKQRG